MIPQQACSRTRRPEQSQLRVSCLCFQGTWFRVACRRNGARTAHAVHLVCHSSPRGSAGPCRPTAHARQIGEKCRLFPRWLTLCCAVPHSISDPVRNSSFRVDSDWHCPRWGVAVVALEGCNDVGGVAAASGRSLHVLPVPRSARHSPSRSYRCCSLPCCLTSTTAALLPLLPVLPPALPLLPVLCPSDRLLLNAPCVCRLRASYIPAHIDSAVPRPDGCDFSWRVG